MKKIFLLTVALGSYMFADNQVEEKSSNAHSKSNEYSWTIDSSDDFTADARSRRGKGQRGRRRGGGGLR
tara:strand:+ start:1350 stop:1556 length:207 start_codon:yes stop_codon:yes gene_type:complete